jgi:hypothetical protein
MMCGILSSLLFIFLFVFGNRDFSETLEGFGEWRARITGVFSWLHEA